MTAKIKTTRVCGGLYKVSNGELTVSVTHFSPAEDGADFTGWVAQSEWNRNYVTDPLYTKREAVEAATRMLNNPDCI